MKKWLSIENNPDVDAKETEFGLNVLEKIGILFDVNSKLVLLILSPLIAL